MAQDDAVDVVVVGAGAAGAVVAWRLATAGIRVRCLEQGTRQAVDRYPSTGRDWEASRFGAFHPSPNVRQLPADYPINDQESPIGIANFNGVGGGTILYSAHFPRFHPSDFSVRSLDGVADDWPISYEDLAPWFALNDRMMGVSGLEGDPAYPPIGNLQPPVPLGRLGETLGRGFNALNWHWWPAYSAITTQRGGRRDPCINLGPCNAGCPQGAKASVDVTYWPEALAHGAELRTECRVREVQVDARGRATGVVYFDRNNEERFQPASVVVLACNGVGTPRLLLNSRSAHFPDGLANRNDLVGRNLMLHPCGYVEGVFAEDLDGHHGPHGCCLLSQEFYETDVSRGFVRGYTMQVLRGAGPVETAVAGMTRRVIPWGAKHHDAFAARLGHTAAIAIIVEDLPEAENRVVLDETLTDRHGIPAPRIHYRLSDNSKKMLSHGLKMGRQVMSAAGAVSTAGFGPVRETGWHLMGTTRMGADPRTSVVDREGRCHDVPNLCIADSSVFVTSGAVNPVSTLQAVALHIADALVRRQRAGTA